MAEEIRKKIVEVEVRFSDAISKMGQYKKNVDFLNNANAELKENLKKGSIQQEEYNKKVAVNNVLLGENKEKITILNKEIREKIKSDKEQESSVKAMRSELKKLSTEYENLTKAERESAKGKELSNKIKDLRSEIKGIDSDLGKNSLTGALSNFLGLNENLVNSIVNLSQSTKTGEVGLKSFFTNVGTSAKAFGASLMTLIANPVFLTIMGIAGIGVVFKFWYDYNKGIAEATRLTKQLTGLTGENASVVRNMGLAISDVYGKELNEVLTAANALSKQMGINADEALKLIKDGFIVGADTGGDFLDIIKEYSPQMKEAGVSASDFIAIIAQSKKEGVFSDKGLDAIKEGNIRLREMTKATADALDGIGISSKKVQEDLRTGAKTTSEVIGDISKKLKELPENSKQVGTVLADVFGGAGEDAGLQFIKLIGDMQDSLEDLKTKAGDFGKLQDELVMETINQQNILSAIMGDTGENFENMTLRIKVAFTKLVNDFLLERIKVVNGVIDIINKYEGLRATIANVIVFVQGIGHAFTAVKNMAIDTAKAVGSIFSKLVDGDFKGALETASSIPKKFGNSMSTEFARFVSETKKDLASISGFVEKGIKPINIPVAVTIDEAKAKQTEDFITSFHKKTKAEMEAWLKDSKNFTDRNYQEAKKIYDSLKKDDDKDGSKGKGKANKTDAAESVRAQILKEEVKFQNAIIDLKKKYASQEIETESELNQAILKEELKLYATKEHILTSAVNKDKSLQEKLSKDLADLRDKQQESLIKYTKEQEKIILDANPIKKEDLRYKERLIAAGIFEKDMSNMTKKELEVREALEAEHWENLDKIRIEAEKKKEEAAKASFSETKTDYENEIAGKENALSALDSFGAVSGSERFVKMLEIQIEKTQLAKDWLNKLTAAGITSGDEYDNALNAVLNAESELTNLLGEEYSRRAELYSNYTQTIGDTLGSLITNQEGAFQAFTDSIIDMMFDQLISFVNTQLAAAIAASAASTVKASAEAFAMPDSVATFGATGIARAAVLTALITGALTVGKSALKGLVKKPKKMAVGGYVSGEGTSTSDSIPVMLSNGESVINARSTAMFAPILSTFNQIGGGVPISSNIGSNVGAKELQKIFEKGVAKGVGKALENMPPTIVSVEEINRVGSKTYNRFDSVRVK